MKVLKIWAKALDNGVQAALDKVVQKLFDHGQLIMRPAQKDTAVQNEKET